MQPLLGQAPSSLGAARILVVDDQEEHARLVQGMLADAGYARVECTTDPREVCERHRASPYDLIILDLVMPGLDGFEVMQRLGETDAAGFLPILAVTAKSDLRERAFHAGARDFLAKPVGRSELLARVRNLLEIGQSLHAAESRFRALVEQSVAGIYVVEDQRITYANPRLCEMLGRTLDELTRLEILDLLVEEDRARLEANRRRREAGEVDALTATYRVRRKDGSIAHLRVSGKLVRLEGREAILGVAQDVTELARALQALGESEGKYRLLWETGSDAVVLLDTDLRIRYANPAVREIFGYAPAELEGREIFALVPERVCERYRQVVSRYLQTRVKTLNWRGTEIAGLHRDGREVPVEVAFNRILLDGSAFYSAFFRDITERKRAQAALEAANARLLDLSQRVHAVQEEERRRIARQLHDDIGQVLIALKLGLNRLAAKIGQRHRPLLDEYVAITDSIREKVRELSVDLHPPELDQLGLVEALRWLVDRRRLTAGLSITWGARGVFRKRAPAAVEGACYRICEEALDIAGRALAKNIVVSLRAGANAIEMTVRHDGTGSVGEAASQAEHLALSSMGERARLAGGRLEENTGPETGTCIRAVFPVTERLAKTADTS